MAVENLTATTAITINASSDEAWHALTDPDTIKKYMFGTTVVTDWKPGGSIVWKGEWEGKPYEDKGSILAFIPGKKLQYTHYSPLTGAPDSPDQYHTITVDLQPGSNNTVVTLSQDGNPTAKDKAHAENNWNMVLAELKKVLEEK